MTPIPSRRSSSEELPDLRAFLRAPIEVPDQLGLFSSCDELGKEILLSHALILFKAGQISIGLAKELASLDLYAFMQACARHGIPVVNYSKEDLLNEIRAINEDKL